MSQLRGRPRRLDVGPTRTLQTRVSDHDHAGFHAVAADARTSISELLAQLVGTHPVLLRAHRAATAAGMPLADYLTALISSDELDETGKPLWAPNERPSSPAELPGISDGLRVPAA